MKMYRYKKNINHVYSLYEQIFTLRREKRSINDYFAVLKGKCNEVTIYHFIINDATVQKQQYEEFLLTKFLS